jgi:hypothetical protein
MKTNEAGAYENASKHETGWNRTRQYRKNKKTREHLYEGNARQRMGYECLLYQYNEHRKVLKAQESDRK